MSRTWELLASAVDTQLRLGLWLYLLLLALAPFDRSLVYGLDEVCNVHRHLIDASVVELFNVVQCTLVFVGDEIDSNAFTART